MGFYAYDGLPAGPSAVMFESARVQPARDEHAGCGQDAFGGARDGASSITGCGEVDLR